MSTYEYFTSNMTEETGLDFKLKKEMEFRNKNSLGRNKTK